MQSAEDRKTRENRGPKAPFFTLVTQSLGPRPLGLVAMTYDEALAFWYGRINYEVRAAAAGRPEAGADAGAAARCSATRTTALRLVHVTGTKGKGSTCAMLASVLRAAGYRVGLFTSPHLDHVEERIQVDGVPISHAELAARMAEVAAGRAGDWTRAAPGRRRSSRSAPPSGSCTSSAGGATSR